MTQIASARRKGLCPSGHEVAAVTFDEHGSPNTYHYWVPREWNVRPGNKLHVVVENRDTATVKRVTVQAVHPFTAFIGREHKCAYRRLDEDEDKPLRDSSTTNLCCNTTAKEPDMIQIETVTYLNGKPIKDCNDVEMFDAIRKTEGEIKGLMSIDNKPRALKERILQLQNSIDTLVNYMDSRP